MTKPLPISVSRSILMPRRMTLPLSAPPMVSSDFLARIRAEQAGAGRPVGLLGAGPTRGRPPPRLPRAPRRCRPSTVPGPPRSRLYPPCAALSAVPAQERLGRRVRLHEAVERRWRETVARAAGQIAGRHERRRLGGGNARDQENYGDAAQPAHGRFRLRRVTLSPASRMGQLSSSV